MNGIIIIDKPGDWTSHDVVAKLRGLLSERRIGHGGTLDPMATGVLPVFVGRATRAVEFIERAEKEYLAGLRLGVETDTQDITGKVLREVRQNVTGDALEAVLPSFRGDILQLPPMYSAVKIGGKKLYELARRGGTAERTPRPVTVRALEITGHDGDDYLLRVVCSKGTYVRTLCHDIGQALGCGGVMSSLRRVRAGGFGIGEAVTLDTVAEAAKRGEAEGLLRPVESLFADRPVLTLTPEQEKQCRNGARFQTDAPDGLYRSISGDGEFLALSSVEKGFCGSVKSFFNCEK